MDDRIVICRKDGTIITGIFRDGQCRKLSFEAEKGKVLRSGAVYTGRVEKIVPSMKSCFVNIGLEENVYVPFEKLTNGVTSPQHKDERIHEGDRILVQIEKPPSKQKPASGVGDYSLAGTSVAFLRGRSGLQFSKKISDSGFRELVKREIRIPDDTSCGIMIRTNAFFYGIETIRRELAALSETEWEILKRFEYTEPGTCLYEGVPDYLLAYRDEYMLEQTDIVTDVPEVYRSMRQFFEMFIPERADRIRMHDSDSIGLYHLYEFKKNIDEAVSRKVWLKSGGNIVFDRTEAMTVIDVNSGKATAGSNGQESLRRTNDEAALEIARQLELRNLSGMILIDFINTGNKEDERQLLQKMDSYTRKDRSYVSVVDMTALGIMELTREKKEPPVSERLKELNFIS